MPTWLRQRGDPRAVGVRPLVHMIGGPPPCCSMPESGRIDLATGFTRMRPRDLVKMLVEETRQGIDANDTPHEVHEGVLADFMFAAAAVAMPAALHPVPAGSPCLAKIIFLCFLPRSVSPPC